MNKLTVFSAAIFPKNLSLFKVLGLLLSLALTANANASEQEMPVLNFAGVWQGQGSIENLKSNTAIETTFQLVIEVGSEKMRISECFINEEQNGIYNCNSEIFSIENDTDVVSDLGKKIGSISNELIKISDEQNQQLSLSLRNPTAMDFDRTKTTEDGTVTRQKAELIQVN